jgi:hypothetical protein
LKQQHKFSVGQQVRYSSSDPDRFRATGTFEVAMLLPIEGSDIQYRIRSSLEKFDRVAKEWQLDLIAERRWTPELDAGS